MLNWIVRNRTVWSFNCVNKWLMFNWIGSETLQYLKLFNCGPLLNYWYYIEILKTIWLCKWMNNVEYNNSVK